MRCVPHVVLTWTLLWPRALRQFDWSDAFVRHVSRGALIIGSLCTLGVARLPRTHLAWPWPGPRVYTCMVSGRGRAPSVARRWRRAAVNAVAAPRPHAHRLEHLRCPVLRWNFWICAGGLQRAPIRLRDGLLASTRPSKARAGNFRWRVFSTSEAHRHLSCVLPRRGRALQRGVSAGLAKVDHNRCASAQRALREPPAALQACCYAHVSRVHMCCALRGAVLVCEAGDLEQRKHLIQHNVQNATPCAQGARDSCSRGGSRARVSAAHALQSGARQGRDRQRLQARAWQSTQG